MLLPLTRHDKPEVLIVLHDPNPLAVQSPGACVSVVPHVSFRTGDNNLGLVCIKFQLIAVGVVGNDIKSSLKTTRSVRKQVSVICDTYCSGTEESEEEAKVGAVEAEEAWIDVDFKMATGPYMTLSIPFKLLNSPADFISYF